jgi:hypothetical protein
MRLLIGLLSYVIALGAVGGGALIGLSYLVTPSAHTAPPQPQAPQVSPRIQMWLERKAEGVTFAERERASAVADRERAEALRSKLAATPEPVTLSADNQQKRTEHERGARAREAARREANRRTRREAQTMYGNAPVYGYAPQPHRFSYPRELLTQRDRYGY